MGFEFTPSQRRAVEDTAGTVLVSAAAGSGKTRVLTERLIRRVTDRECPADIDRFLVITYTRAAAAELRGRIMEALGREAAAHPEDRRLRRQQTLCCRAHIGTIHSFCAELLRENCHLLGLPPAFTVADEDRAEELRRMALSRLLDRRYARIGEDPDFRLLADTLGAGQDDRRLEEAVLSLHEKLRSQPDPEAWAERQKRALRAEGETDIGHTVWGAVVLDAVRAEVCYHSGRMERAAAEIAAAGGALEKAYGPSFAATCEALRDLLRALGEGWDRARSFAAIPFPRLGALRGHDDPAQKQRLTDIRDGCKRAAARWAETFDRDSGALLRDQRAAAPAMDALLELTLALDAAFSREKLRRSCLDFPDLEHYAAALLSDRAAGSPTPLAREISRRFIEVMVDEYQDVSPIQDLLIRCVSREEGNLFLVGDVKQSIYRFRLAEPGLFLEKYRSYADAETAPALAPRRILLRENFRSRKCVLDAANSVFSAIMSRELGELDYDDAAALCYGARGYPPDTDHPAELVILGAEASEAAGDGDESAPPPEKQEREARYVARRIRAMMDAGEPVYLPEGSRRCGWGDFVILLRSPGTQAGLFHRVLAEQGIPVAGRSTGGFFSSLEITVAVNLLALTDNPHADVPLISVLRAPILGFSPDDLSAIRAGAPEADFYGAVRAAAERGDRRCADFLSLLEVWRALAPDLTPEALLWRICGDTRLFAVCAAMEDGETRRRNLMQLFEYARAFCEGGGQGLFRFVSQLRRMAEKGVEPEAPDAEEAVHLLSIHRSKGLEFPFVFLCGLNHQFNKTDVRSSVLVHRELGLGPKYVDPVLRFECPTLARRAIALRQETELLSEEMRVLYVAMTRARERLIMTSVWKKPEETLEKLRSAASRPLPPALLRAAPSPDRWIALAAACGEGEITVVLEPEAEESVPPAAEDAAEAAAAAEPLCGRIETALDYTYPYGCSVDLPSRLTATELKGGEDPEPEAGRLSGAAAPEEYTFRRVDFGQKRALTAAERGSAAHTFLQYLDLQRRDVETREQLRAELDRITAAGHLTRQERDSVELDAIARLLSSPLGRAMREAGTLRREFRFTLMAPAADYCPGAAAEDEVLLQGVVDCCFVRDGAITIVDYKTDRVSPAEAPARAERYRGQLDAYTTALRRITGLPVARRVLWFLHPGVEIEL